MSNLFKPTDEAVQYLAAKHRFYFTDLVALEGIEFHVWTQARIVLRNRREVTHLAARVVEEANFVISSIARVGDVYQPLNWDLQHETNILEASDRDLADLVKAVQEVQRHLDPEGTARERARVDIERAQDGKPTLAEVDGTTIHIQ